MPLEEPDNEESVIDETAHAELENDDIAQEETAPEEPALDVSVPEPLAPEVVPEPVLAVADVDAETIESYRKLKVGDSLDMVNEDGRVTAAHISWTSPISGRHMLSNRRGQRILVASVDELVAMHADGQVRIRSNDAAFDVALNSLADRLARTMAAS